MSPVKTKKLARVLPRKVQKAQKIKKISIEKKLYRPGIMGVGMVGGTLANVLKNPILYDPFKDLGSVRELQKADMIFICVPTPYDEKKGGFDLTEVHNAIALLETPKVIVIKSTVLPGTTEKLQRKYPEHRFLFNPEFLTEATADQDMRYPDRQIVGFTKQSFNLSGILMQMLPLAPFEKIMPATEAEMVKYFGNTWFSVKVIFANQMYDLCKGLRIDYDSVKEAAAADKRIGRTHLEIFHKGYRGYGGKCLPKDTRALIQKGEELGIPMKLLKMAEELNAELQRSNARDKDR